MSTKTIMDYDPNLNMSGNKSVQTVALTFGLWTHRYSTVVEVTSNLTGLSLIEFAVGRAYEMLPRTGISGGYTMAVLHMDELTVEDDELQGEEWLNDMLIHAEITAIRPAV